MGSFFEIALVMEAVDRVSGTLRRVGNAMTDLEKRAKSLNEAGKSVSIAGAFTEHAAARMRGWLAGMTGPAVALKKDLFDLSNVIIPVTGTVEDALGRAQTAADDFATRYGVSAAAFRQATYMMSSASLDETAAVAASRTASAVAIATMGDAGEAANLIGVIYNNMADKAGDAAEQTLEFKTAEATAYADRVNAAAVRTARTTPPVGDADAVSPATIVRRE